MESSGTSTGSPTTETPPESSPLGPEPPPAPEQPPVQEELAAKAAAQSPAEPQTVPEQRPQSFTGPELSQQSATSQRFAGAPAHGQEEIDAANSDKNKEAASQDGRVPNLTVGQRVTLVGDHSEAGRMAYVTQVVYKDGIQGLLAGAGTPEARFADVLQYILVTRDGRSDTLVATPDQVRRLDDIEGWGRGQI